MGLNHTAAMLSPVGLKPKLVPKHFNSRLGVQNLLSMANMAAERIRPPGGGGGDSHMEQTGMLVGNFEFNP